MATTCEVYKNGDGTEGPFTFTFPYLKDADIKVTVDGTLKSITTHYTIETSPSVGIKFTSGNFPAAGTNNIRIYRDTDVDAAKAVYAAGSSIRASDLNSNQEQALYALQEEQSQEIVTADIRDKAITSAKLDTNIDIAGTLDVTGATDLDSTLNVDGATQLQATGIDGNLDVNTNKFTVTASSGNTDIAGTLDVTGTATFKHEENVKFLNSGDAYSGVDNGFPWVKDDVGFNVGRNPSDFTDLNGSFWSKSDNTVYVDAEKSSGNLNLRTNGGHVRLSKFDPNDLDGETGDELLARGVSDGAFELYHNNSKKFETTSDGGKVTGKLEVTGNTATVGSQHWFNADHEGTPANTQGGIYSSGSAATVWLTDNGAFEVGANPADASDYDGQYWGNGSNVFIECVKDGGNLNLRPGDVSGKVKIAKFVSPTGEANDELMAQFSIDGAAELYHDNSLKIETRSDGSKVHGNATVTGKTITDTLSLGGTDVESSAAKLNILKDKTFKASTDGTLDTTSDTEIPSSKAINARIVTVADSVGGFKAISNKTSFPNTHPDPNSDAGTVISISDAAGIRIDNEGVANFGSGQATTLSGNVVEISGFPTPMKGGELHGPPDRQIQNANPYEIPSGVALLVQTTGDLNKYTYHKVQPSESDVVALNHSVEDFQARYRLGTDNPTGHLDEGDLFYNKTTNKMLVYNGSAWVDIASTGNYFNATLTSAGAEGDTIPGGSATFNGTAKKFGINLTGDQAPSNAFQITVSLNGVIQKPNSGTSVPSEGFAWDSTNSWLIFADAIPASTPYFIVVSGSNVNVTTVQEDEIDLAQLKHQDAGDILYYGASGVPALLNKDVGKFLKSGTNGPTWDTVTTTTDLSNTANGTSLTVESSTGTNTALPAATTSAWGVMTDEDKTKLDGIETNADVTDATNVTSAGAVMKTIVDAKGDIIVGTADNTYNRLAVGDADGKVLSVDSSTSTGLAWAAASSGTITALNNQAENRLTTIGATTTELDGEANLTFNGSTLAVTGNQTVSTTLAATGQITGRGFECPHEVSDDWAIAAGNNAMFPGPMTVASGKTVTVPADRTLTIV